MPPVSSDKLKRTVERMEKRLGELNEPAVQDLFAVYRRLISRFADDLTDERDEFLSRAAVLMLIQDVAEGARQDTVEE